MDFDATSIEKTMVKKLQKSNRTVTKTMKDDCKRRARFLAEAIRDNPNFSEEEIVEMIDGEINDILWD